MAATDDILAKLPLDQIAARLGSDPASVRRAAASILPALLGGMQANAATPAGEASLVEAVRQHDDGLADGLADGSIGLDRVDTADGEKITRHILGSDQSAVATRLAGPGGSKDLVAKLLPILAPIVLSHLARRMGAGRAGSVGAGGLGGILGEVLAGAAQGAGGRQSSGGGGLLARILGSLFKRR